MSKMTEAGEEVELLGQSDKKSSVHFEEHLTETSHRDLEIGHVGSDADVIDPDKLQSIWNILAGDDSKEDVTPEDIVLRLRGGRGSGGGDKSHVAKSPTAIDASGFQSADAAIACIDKVVADRTPVELGWSDLSFKVGDKQILKKCNGVISPGDFCAIMGPSGAGKSSLMNVLAGRIRSTGKISVTGTITANGQQIKPVKYRKRIAYVMQEDALFATQTPREALNFSANLRLPNTMKQKEISQLVESIIDCLGLSKCANTMIGSVMLQGISGGEKKRTAIGVELVSNPDVLFLDEPTSGLDSFAAFQVVNILKLLAKSGRTIITTIHQPSSETFEVFDTLLLMANGHLIYHDKLSGMLPYFAGQGHICPEHYNPADFVMFMIQQQSKESVDSLVAAWEKVAAEKAKHHVQSAVEGGDGVERKSPDRESLLKTQATGLSRTTKARAGVVRQFKLLILREARNFLRDKPALGARFIGSFFLNLVVGLVFRNAANWSGCDGSPESVLAYSQNHFGALVQIGISGMFGLSQPTLLAFPIERPVFLREYAVGTYGAAAYFWSKVFVEIPLMFMQSLVIFLAVYWLIGLSANFFVMACLVALLGLVASSTSLLIGAFAEDVTVAIQLVPLIFVPQILFAGFFIPITAIPEWLRWAQYLCSLRYALNMLMIVEFKDLPNGWNPDLPEENYYNAMFGCSGANLTKDYTCIEEGPGYEFAVFPRNEVVVGNVYIYLGILLAVFVVFRCTALFCLTRKAKK